MNQHNKDIISLNTITCLVLNQDLSNEEKVYEINKVLINSLSNVNQTILNIDK